MRHPLQDQKTTIYYNQIVNNKEYSFRILNFLELNYTGDKEHQYIVYDAVSLDDYSELHIQKEQPIFLHLPRRSWERELRAVLNSSYIASHDFSQDSSCDVSFIRKEKYISIVGIWLYSIGNDRGNNLLMDGINK